MSISIRTWASLRDFNAGQGESGQVGQQVADLLEQSLTGRGERPFANLSGPDAERLISTIERTGGKRTATEQKLLDFLRGPASDGRSKSFLRLGDGQVIAVGATRGATGGRAVLRADELRRQAAAGTVTVPSGTTPQRAELDARAARVFDHDPALEAHPVDQTVQQFLLASGTSAQAGLIEENRAVFLEAAASFITGAIASWVENDVHVPAELVGHKVTASELPSPSPALAQFLSDAQLNLHDRGEITRYTENGTEIGTVISFNLYCGMDLTAWRFFYDAEAGYFTTLAVLDGIIAPSRTEQLTKPR